MSDEMDLGVLAESFSEMLGAEWPREKAIAYAYTNGRYADALWTTMAELGWMALTVPEAHGGLDLGLDAAARLHMALGAAVAPAPMLGTTLAVPAELETRSQRCGIRADEGIALAANDLGRNGPALVFGERGLVIEHVQLAGRSGHEQMNHSFGLGRKVRSPDPEQIPLCRRGVASQRIREETGQAYLAKADAAILEKMPAGDLVG